MGSILQIISYLVGIAVFLVLLGAFFSLALVVVVGVVLTALVLSLRQYIPNWGGKRVNGGNVPPEFGTMRDVTPKDPK